MCTEGRRGIRVALLGLALLLAHAAAGAADSSVSSAADEVRSTEQAFAQTMAERDFDAFRRFLSPEAVFFSGETALRGAEAVAAAWKPYFEAPEAPFSWRPDTVEVLESGALALSSGPVFDPAGVRVGRFNSIWRRDAEGRWRIVFDKGEKACGD